MDPHEKAIAAGIPDTGALENETYSVEDNVGLGDALMIQIYDENDNLLHEITEWKDDVYHEGITMTAGSILIAGSYGTGRTVTHPI